MSEETHQQLQEPTQTDNTDSVEASEPRHSRHVSHAVQMTASLWGLDTKEWDKAQVDVAGQVLSPDTAQTSTKDCQRGGHSPVPKAKLKKTKAFIHETVGRAYIKLQPTSINEWFKKVNLEDFRPNEAQNAMLRRVAERCTEERQELQNFARRQQTTEP